MFAPKNVHKASPTTPRGRIQIVKQTYADGSTYEGGYLNFKKQGKGIISFANGEKYDGQWAEGSKEGSGVYTWADGSHYTGNWHSDRMSGEGVHVSSNGSKYEGSWADNVMHGCGSYEYDNGSLYKGEWYQGQQQGSGTLVVCAKEKYEGSWQMGLMHGKGTYVWENGDIYCGHYEDGKKNGSGKLSLASGEEYHGEWSLGLKHGYGVYTCNDSESYQGEWCADRMHGEGQYFWPDGSFYKGTWVSDSRSGQGTERLSDGSQYEGGFLNNARNGLGAMLYLDGSKYEGNWQQEHWHGHGTFTSADGSALEGVFIKGVIHGHGTENDSNGEFFYEGDWKNGIREGHGLLKTPIGEYVGEFVAGKKHGQGIDSFASGSKYVGQFIENQRHGRGVISHSNGTTYDGHWKFGERCGQGKYEESSGYGYIGEWEHDMKHGQGIETIDKDTSYEGQFFRGARHGKGRTTTFKSTASPEEETETGYCIHEGMYAQDKKYGVGSETYPDGSCFHGVWSDGLKHGPGLLKIAHDTTYHVIFHEDTIVDIFYSMEPEAHASLSSSNFHGHSDDEKVVTDGMSEAAERNILQQISSLSVAANKNGNVSIRLPSSTQNFSSTNHARFDPFRDENNVNADKYSPQPSSCIDESAQIAPINQLSPFPNISAETTGDIYDMDETDLPVQEAISSLSTAELLKLPSQVTVIVDYGFWGAPCTNDPLHAVPSRTPRLKSASTHRDLAIQSPANPSLSTTQVHSRRSHASRHHGSSAKQHRVPGSTSRESLAGSLSGSKVSNKIDIFNL